MEKCDVFRDWAYVRRDIKSVESSFSSSSEDLGSGSVTVFSGVAVIGSEYIRGDTASHLSADACVNASGQFTAVIDRPDGRTVLLTDFYGFQSIFYYEGEIKGRRCFLASNRFVVLIDRLRQIGASLSLDAPHLVNSLYSDDTFFQQAYSHRTACEQIKLLPVDRYIVVHEGHVRFPLKKGYAKAYLKEGKYDDLIESASIDIKSTIHCLASSSKINTIISSLTGGKDSRLVLGFILKSGLTDKVRVYTEDYPSNPADLLISSSLADKYNLNWFEGDDRAQTPITVRQGLSVWRYFLSNLYHRFGLVFYSAMASNLRTIEMTGAGGEVFRSFWSPWARRKGVTEGCGKDGIVRVYRNLLKNGVPTGLSDAAEDAFLTSIDGLPGESVLEKFDNHYLFFRNRTHFGGSDQRQYLKNLTWNPLASAKLLAASRVLPQPHREAGVMLYDLQEKFMPELNDIEFDKNPWDFSGIRKLRPSGLRLEPGSRSRWELSEKRRKSSLDRRRVRKSPVSVLEIESTIAEEITRFTEIIADHGYGNILSAALPASSKPNELFSKLSSAVDVLEPDGLWDKRYKIIS